MPAITKCDLPQNLSAVNVGVDFQLRYGNMSDLRSTVLTTRLCLARHGETDWNSERRLQGQTDIALNAQGEEQARQLAEALHASGLSFDGIYTSSLLRALDTARPVATALGLNATVLPELQERHFGALQGLRMDEAAHINPGLWQVYLDRLPDHELDGGESLNQFAKRIQGALRSLHRQHAGQTLLVIAHGGVLDTIYRIASGQSMRTQRMVLVPNASLNWVNFDGETLSIERWADTRHLSAVALDDLQY